MRLKFDIYIEMWYLFAKEWRKINSPKLPKSPRGSAGLGRLKTFWYGCLYCLNVYFFNSIGTLVY